MSESGSIKLAVLSPVLPPLSSGQTMMLYRLLVPLRPDDYVLLSRESYRQPRPEHTLPRLPGRYYHLPSALPLPAPNLPGVRIPFAVANLLLQVRQRAAAIERILRREHCQAIVACSGDLDAVDVPAAYLASRRTKLPLYIYLFDDYLYQRQRRLDRLFVRVIERRIFGDAAGVIVPNEFLGDEYRRRCGVDATIVRNACPAPAPELAPEAPWPARAGEIHVVYTGAVYMAHFDAFRRLVGAITQLRRPGLNLQLYTPQSAAELAREQITGPVRIHPHLAPAEARALQQQADILLLPLAFQTTYPELIRTSAPVKMAEYLGSGRPILVHAPADSWVSWYFRHHACGLVVDQPDPDQLANAIRQLIDDAELRRRLVRNALCRARSDFDVEHARAEFSRLLRRPLHAAG